MRDYRGLEEIAGAVSTGLLAGDVIVAADQVLRGDDLDDHSAEALRAGSRFLHGMAHPEETVTSTSSTGGLMATGAAFDAVAAAHSKKPPTEVREFVEELAVALDHAAEGRQFDYAALTEAIDVFSLLGDVELARANNLSRERQEPARWLGRQTTLSRSS